MSELTQTMKAWKAGTGTLVVTIPKNIKKLQSIEEGDYIEVTFKRITNETTEFIQEEKRKINQHQGLSIER